MWKGEGKGYRQGERSKRKNRGREEWRRKTGKKLLETVKIKELKTTTSLTGAILMTIMLTGGKNKTKQKNRDGKEYIQTDSIYFRFHIGKTNVTIRT